MTREQAHKILSNGLTNAPSEHEWCMAFDMAIKALKQGSSEDCIARQPLIDNWNCCADMLMGECDAEVVMGWIFDAPSVTPQPKTDVLDKIRAEIKEVYNDRPHNYNHSQRTELFCEVIKIIDKYYKGDVENDDKRTNK